MTDFELRTEAEMPPRRHAGGATRHGLTDAIRNLKAGQAIFIPANGREPMVVGQNLSGQIGKAGRRGQVGTRLDSDGVWIYVKGDDAP